MFNTNISNFWPDFNEDYVDSLKNALDNKMLDCKKFLLDSDFEEFKLFCELTESKLKTFYRISERPHIIDTKSKESKEFIWGKVNIIELLLSNGRRQRIIIALPHVIKEEKIIIAIHGTHESPEYFLNMIEDPRTGHENAVGFMIPFVKSGYIVVCSQLPCFGDDYPGRDFSTKHFTDYIMQVDYLSRLTGFSYMNEVLFRHLAVIDYLYEKFESITFLSVLGYSLGGESALCIAACDKRIDAVIEYMGTSTLASRVRDMAKKRNRTQVFGSGIINDFGDYWALGVCVYPRPYHKFIREGDQFCDFSAVLDMVDIYKILYGRFGFDENFSHTIMPGPHRLDEDMALKGSKWLDVISLNNGGDQYGD